MDVVKARLAHESFQCNPPDLFIKQQYFPPYGDTSFAYRNKTGHLTICFLRVAVYRRRFYILSNMLKDDQCMCARLSQFECEKWKYFITLRMILRKKIFVIKKKNGCRFSCIKHAAIRKACLEVGIICLHYNKHTSFRIKMDNKEKKLCHLCFVLTCAGPFKYLAYIF